MWRELRAAAGLSVCAETDEPEGFAVGAMRAASVDQTQAASEW